MNEIEQKQYNEIEQKINELANKIGTPEYNNSYSFKKELYKEIIELYDKENLINPHTGMKLAKIKFIKAQYQEGIILNEGLNKAVNKLENSKDNAKEKFNRLFRRNKK